MRLSSIFQILWDFLPMLPPLSSLILPVFPLLSLCHWSEFCKSCSFQRYPTSGDRPIHAISILLNHPLNPEFIVSVPEHDALRLIWAINFVQIMPWSWTIVGKVICTTIKSIISQNVPLATQVQYCQRRTEIHIILCTRISSSHFWIQKFFEADTNHASLFSPYFLFPAWSHWCCWYIRSQLKYLTSLHLFDDSVSLKLINLFVFNLIW